jgi:hypothetical protein
MQRKESTTLLLCGMTLCIGDLANFLGRTSRVGGFELMSVSPSRVQIEDVETGACRYVPLVRVEAAHPASPGDEAAQESQRRVPDVGKGPAFLLDRWVARRRPGERSSSSKSAAAADRRTRCAFTLEIRSPFRP